MNIPSHPEQTVVLFGSPRSDGVSAQVLSALCELCDGSVTVVDAYQRQVQPCDDCRGCHRVCGCVKRDMDDVYEAIEQADRLVIVTPVYNRSFPAPLKALIDRLQCYWAKRFVHGIRPPIAKPRTALLVTVCGSDRADGECLMHQLEPQLTVLHVCQTRTLHIRNTDTATDTDTIRNQLKTML